MSDPEGSRSQVLHPDAGIKRPFRELVTTLRRWTHGFLYGNPQLPSSEPLMPSAIEYALLYKKGLLGYPEIAALIGGGFLDLSTYTLLKALDTKPQEQKDFLEQLVDLMIANPVPDRLLPRLQKQTLDTSLGIYMTGIKGAKIAQVIRQGNRLWGDKFAQVAEEVKTSPEVIPVYIAYAGTLGLRQCLKALKGSGRPVMVYIPDWLNESSNPFCGYNIELGNRTGSRVNFLPRNFSRPDNFWFIDDTRRNGLHTQIAWDFWDNYQGHPLSESRIRVVDYAPKHVPI